MHKYLKEACLVAAKGNPRRKCFVGSVGKRRDGTIVQSANIWNCSYQGRSPSSHAEARLCKKLDYGSVVYVGRVRKDNFEIALAKPCPRCESVLKNTGVSKVFYTIGPNEWGCLEF